MTGRDPWGNTPVVPFTILVHPEFFENKPASPFVSKEGQELVCGEVLAIFRDSVGTMHAAFEVTDMLGVMVIGLDSIFFRGWSI